MGEVQGGLGVAGLYRSCLDFVGSLESERLGDNILQVAAKVADAGGGVLWTGTRELVVAAVRGLAAAGRRLDPIRTDGPMGPRLREGKAFIWKEASGQATLRVPITTRQTVVGMIELTDPIEGGNFSESAHVDVEFVAEFAAVALQNVATIQSLRRRSLKDPVTGTYNLLYFVEYVGKEIHKARRYGRKFSLVAVKIDNLHQLKSLFSPEVVAKLVQRLVDAIRGALRDADLVAKVVDDEFYILLPETDYLGARLFIQKVGRSFRRSRHASDLERTHPVVILCGAAAFPRDGGDFEHLLQACQEQIDVFRGSLHHKLSLGDLSLWQMVELFVGREEWYQRIETDLPPKPLAVTEDAQGRSRHLRLNRSVYRAIQSAALAEVARSKGVRGVLYLSVHDASDLEFLSGVTVDLAGSGTTVFLLTPPDLARLELPGMTVLTVGDAELAAHELTLLMTETTAYGFVGQRDSDAGIFGYHSADPIVVETFIAKLQNHYYLQGRF